MTTSPPPADDLATREPGDASLLPGPPASTDQLARIQGMLDKQVRRLDAMLAESLTDMDERVEQRLSHLEATLDQRIPKLESTPPDTGSDQADLAERMTSRRSRSIRAAVQTFTCRSSYKAVAFLRLAGTPRRWIPAIMALFRRSAALRDSPAEPIWGRIDSPADGSEVLFKTVCFLEGWALSRLDPLDRVEVCIDGVPVGRARLGLPRPDVAVLSDHPAAPIAGFQMVLDPDIFPAGAEQVSLSVMAFDVSGRSLAVPPRTLKLQPSLSRTPYDGPIRTRATPSWYRGSFDATQPLRLACFAHDLGYGGGQLYLTELIRQIQRQCSLECTVVSPFDGPLSNTLRELGVDVVIRPNPPWQTDSQYQRRLRSLAAWLEEGGFNAVIANTVLAFAPVTAAEQLGIPTAWAIHESYPLSLWCTLNGWHTPEMLQVMTGRIKEALAITSAAVFEAEGTRQLFLPYMEERHAVKVPYGIDTHGIGQFLRRFDREKARQQLRLMPQQRVVTCIGTFESRKQQTVLAQGFAAIAGEHQDSRLILIGDYEDHESKYSQALRDYVDRAGLHDRVTILPATEDIYSWYGVSDLFVLASDVESMPRTFLECMCFGVPVLGTNIFGIPELVEDGVTGFLVEPNSLGELISRLNALLGADSATLQQVGMRGQRLIQERYDSERYAISYLKLLTGLRAGLNAQVALNRPE